MVLAGVERGGRGGEGGGGGGRVTDSSLDTSPDLSLSALSKMSLAAPFKDLVIRLSWAGWSAMSILSICMFDIR